MTDCANADIRDRLPDLLHERLDASVRASIVAHLAECVDCSEELALLRGMHRVMLADAPRIDVAHVVRALPKPPGQAGQVIPLRAASRRSTWIDWRVAAAVTLLAAGGGSVALMNRSASVPSIRPETSTVAMAPRGSSTAAANVLPAGPEQGAANGETGVDGRLVDLSDQQLESLLQDIGGLTAVPVTEPEPVSIRVNPYPSTPGAGDS